MRYPDILLQNTGRAKPNNARLDMCPLPKAIAAPGHDAFCMARDRNADLQMRRLERGQFARGVTAQIGRQPAPGQVAGGR